VRSSDIQKKLHSFFLTRECALHGSKNWFCAEQSVRSAGLSLPGSGGEDVAPLAGLWTTSDPGRERSTPVGQPEESELDPECFQEALPPVKTVDGRHARPGSSSQSGVASPRDPLGDLLTVA